MVAVDLETTLEELSNYRWHAPIRLLVKELCLSEDYNVSAGICHAYAGSLFCLFNYILKTSRYLVNYFSSHIRLLDLVQSIYLLKLFLPLFVGTRISCSCSVSTSHSPFSCFGERETGVDGSAFDPVESSFVFDDS